jgi:hypothetical protein
VICTCSIADDSYAADYHLFDCARRKDICPGCGGEGSHMVYPCGDPSCCQEREQCDECNGTGNVKLSLPPDDFGMLTPCGSRKSD